MQSVPLLLRQSLRSSPAGGSFSAFPRTAPAAARVPSVVPNNALIILGRGGRTARGFSVCRRCQFRERNILAYSVQEDNTTGKDGRPAIEPAASGETKDLPQEGDFHVPKQDQVNAEGQQDFFTTENAQQGHDGTGGGRGGLPSYKENRRSRYTKQFSEMMDNLQSNIFVAGQRLNDLTGYSSIEALKREIQNQEERLRTARRHVREAKDNYAFAINRRSTSQREVNELLQRKHAWSSSDLERFTSLYRNDHTNEVSENEAQEALGKAEREAEEAATQLSRNILSRYHEEQVWSDKIRRMSTWGTWGLMGVNVLLFLVFQIGVEPWRRKRLVKGFEEKVIEAMEKEKTLTQEQSAALAAATAQSTTPPATSTTTTAPDQASLEQSTSEVPDTPASPTASATSTTPDTAATTPAEPPIEIIEYGKSHISPPSTSIESWRRTLHDLLSDRTLAISQRDLTSVAAQSAAAGAAVMGLVIAIIRPR